MKKALVEGRGGDTERSRVLDIARGSPWPRRYTGRALRNEFLDRWRHREEELQADAVARQAYQDAAARDDLDVIPVWASEAVDLISEVESAAALVEILVSTPRGHWPERAKSEAKPSQNPRRRSVGHLELLRAGARRGPRLRTLPLRPRARFG